MRSHSEAGLRVINSNSYPELWADLNAHLAAALCFSGTSNELAQSLIAHTNALSVRTRERYPDSWGKLQLSVARAFVTLSKYDNATLAQAEAACNAVISEPLMQRYPHYLIEAYVMLGEINVAPSIKNFPRANRAFQTALQLCRQHNLSEAERIVRTRLARVTAR